MSYTDDMHVERQRARRRTASPARSALPQFTFDPNSTATLGQIARPGEPELHDLDIAGRPPRGCATHVDHVHADRRPTTQLLHDCSRSSCGKAHVRSRASAERQTAELRAAVHRCRLDRLAHGHAPHHRRGDAEHDAAVLRHPQAARREHDLTLHTPRIGFFGTLAFDANWGTNATNEARVTANQSLIVAIGQSIDGEKRSSTSRSTRPTRTTRPTRRAQGCHSQLDPYKQYFRQSYTLYYHDQTDTDADLAARRASHIDGVTTTGHGRRRPREHARQPPALPARVGREAALLGELDGGHGRRPRGRCASPTAFQDSKFDFKTLVRELFSLAAHHLASGTQDHARPTASSSASRAATSSARRSRTAWACPTSAAWTRSSRRNAQSDDRLARRCSCRSTPTTARTRCLRYPTESRSLLPRERRRPMCRLIADQVVDVKAGTSRYTSTNPEPAHRRLRGDGDGTRAVGPARAGRARRSSTTTSRARRRAAPPRPMRSRRPSRWRASRLPASSWALKEDDAWTPTPTQAPPLGTLRRRMARPARARDGPAACRSSPTAARRTPTRAGPRRAARSRSTFSCSPRAAAIRSTPTCRAATSDPGIYHPADADDGADVDDARRQAVHRGAAVDAAAARACSRARASSTTARTRTRTATRRR